MGLNDIFDHIYCVNLKHRTDRWINCLKQFEKYGIEVERFEAVNGNEVAPDGVNKLLPGEVGVIRSNYNIIKDAKEKGYKRIMIFEDDVVLSDDFNERFKMHFLKTPEDWRFLYLGGNHVGGLTPINDKVARIKHTYAIHAIGVHEELYDHILTMLEEERVQVDVTYAQLQKIFPSYVFRPHLAWQTEGFGTTKKTYLGHD